ncbi:MAG: ATP-binding protein [Jaaginema sp. PMC 1080.18]|nr:ATP-binding protein [Jaaginema sp. PMC 1080.18]
MLAPILQQTHTPLSVNETVFTSGTVTSTSNIADALDLAAVLNASQAISSEIERDRLISTLLTTVMQMSGASQCVLMLQNESDLTVQAQAKLTELGEIETQVLLHSPVPLSDIVPISLVNTVKRNLEPAVITDATEHPQLVNDAYIQAQQPKSLLCCPILHQGKLLGIVYLENNLVIGAFTRDRVELLNLLCAQAAISWENARLYRQSQEAFVQLRDRENRLQNLAANIPGMVYRFCLAPDGSTSTPYVSSGCLDLYELEPTDVMTGKYSVAAMHHPDDDAAVQQALMTSRQNLTPFVETWRIITPSGKVKWLQSAARPEKQADGSVIWDGVVLDISDRKQAEAAVLKKSQELEQALTELQNTQLQMVQNEKMATLGNLVAGVAHEINNPIGFLNGSINNLKDYLQDLFEHLAFYQEQQPPNEVVRDNAEDMDIEFLLVDLPKLTNSMQGATNRIKGISNSLRIFSRADTEYKVRANLHEGLDSTLLILKYRLKANDLRPAIEVVQNYGDLPEVKCFPGQLNQVFMNILANAIDMFDEMAQQTTFADLTNNPQKITIQTAIGTEPNEVEIRITDNGKGMSEGVKSRVFDHLFTTKGVGKGTGLGLAIAHQIVTQTHSGQLMAESTLGQGSEFIIHLPIA